MVNATPAGEHMSISTFRRALEWSSRFDAIVLLSGGEPTEHPEILEFIRTAAALFPIVQMTSNGTFLDGSERMRALLATGAFWQITNDPRYYPRRVARVTHPRVTHVPRLRAVVRLGRYKGRSTRMGPLCFNLRSAFKTLGSLGQAIRMLRTLDKPCTPSIDIDGTIRAGESNSCFALGTIWDSDRDLAARLERHDCDRCGLFERLPLDIQKVLK